MKPRHILICLLLASSLACTSTLIADFVAQPGDVLFKDDFSDPSSGWARSTSDPANDPGDGSLVDYADGAFRIFVNSPNYQFWTNPSLAFEDVRVEVDAALVAGPEINQIGLVCRYVDEQNFYFFIVSSDGYYAIGKIKDDALTLLGSNQMEYAAAIRDGNEINHLRADCVGKTLTFYANDRPLGIIEDADFTSGDVGLIAGAFDESGVDVRFDNFVVYKP